MPNGRALRIPLSREGRSMPTPVIVQTSSAEGGGGGASLRIAFDNPTTDGNSIVVPVSLAPDSFRLTITSVEDDAGNEYVQIPGARVTDSATSNSSDVWWCPSGASAQSITVNLSAASPAGGVGGTIYEVSSLSGAVPTAITLADIVITDGSSFDGPSLNGGAEGAFYLTNLSGFEGAQQNVAAPWAILETEGNGGQSTATLVGTGIQQAVFTPQFTEFIGCISGVVFHVVFSISGNAGVGSALISYSGTSSGNVTADGSGNYTIPNLLNGSYTITPSLSGSTFTPPSRNVSVSGADVTGVDFSTSGPPTHGWSPIDCRVAVPGFGPGANFGVVQPDGSVHYVGQISSNEHVPTPDAREAGAPVDSRVDEPINSRVDPSTVSPD
jgi:hypothetical protein